MMASAIEKLLTRDDLHARCSELGLERAKRHRWSAVAGKVFSELDRIAWSR
jgi:hypothetical protein